MPNLLDSILAADAANVFCNPDEFGESVVFTPRSGTPRTITVIVERYSPQQDDSGETRPFMRVTAINSSTTGIDASSVNYGGDKIAVAYKRGGTAKDYLIQAAQGVENHDAGMITVELR